MRWFFLILIAMIAAVIGIAGFPGELPGGKYSGKTFSSRPYEFLPDMDDQPKVKAQASSDFFADGMGARNPVANTVPMGFELPDKPAQEGGFQPYGFTHGKDYYNSGRFGDYWGDGFPEQVEVNEAFIRRGKERYDIYCGICHGDAGDGKGVTSKFGIMNIANFNLPQFSDPTHPQYRANGSFFNTITNGQGTMGGYGASIAVRDRWAIVAYIRALQKLAGQPAGNGGAGAPSPPNAN